MVAIKAAFSVSLLTIVVASVHYFYGLGGIFTNIQQLSFPIVAATAAGLIANAMLAAVRFKMIASGSGHHVSFRQSMAAVGAGSLGGAIFFQLAGQLMARGIIMNRAGMSFGAVIVINLYERLVAAFVTGLIALLGALYVFGKIYLDQSANGAELIKIFSGLVLATGLATWLGFGRDAKRNLKPFLTRQFVGRLFRVVVLTIVVQLPMMAAYVIVAKNFSSQTSVIDLIAASAIVMFAASVPISLAGWGVRELSAVVALGAIGMAAADALTTAIIIGAGSMLAMTVILIASLQISTPQKLKGETEVGELFDYARALSWVLPLAAAILVLFQIYVPVRSGLLNVNLADPIAILGGSLFVLKAIGSRRLPRWRVDHVNLFAVLATLALAGSLLIGGLRFGWTDWALVNRFFGWFVLLAFAATGALMVSDGGQRALRMLVLTYIGAISGVMMLEIIMTYMVAAGVPLSGKLIQPGNLKGFAQNRNFFAFQILMCAAGALVVLQQPRLRVLMWSLILLSLYYVGSRSGWIAIICVLAASIYLGVARFRELALGFAIAAAVALVTALFQGADIVLSSIEGFKTAQTEIIPNFVPSGISTSERITTLVGGWALFLDHPVFGAGLGAFRNQMNLGTSGIPLVIHSTYLWLLAELGLVGFLVFAAGGIYVWVTEWRHASREQASAVVALCFVGFAVMSGPADMVYQRTFWLMVGAALAVPRLTGRNDAAC